MIQQTMEMDPDRKQLHYKFQGSRGSWPKENASSCSGRTMRRAREGGISGGVMRGSSNQVEMIVGDSLVRWMGGSNDNDHSFVHEQQQQSPADLEAEQQPGGAMLLFCRADDDDDRSGVSCDGRRSSEGALELPSGEYKLMRQKEVEQLQQQQRIVGQQDNKQQFHDRTQLEQLVKPARSRLPSKLSLKSPIFATNTLDEDDLNKLASKLPRQEDQTQTKRAAAPNERRLPVVVGCAGEVAENYSARQRKHPMRDNSPGPHSQVTDCGRNRSTNMINRRHNETATIAGDQNASYLDPLAAVAQDESGSGDTGSPQYPASCSRLESSVQEDRSLGSLNSSNATATCDAELERGGPTPTNDLIRTLIHRDRMALLTTSGQSQQRARRAPQSEIVVVSDNPKAPDSGSSGIEYWHQQQQQQQQQQLMATSGHHYQIQAAISGQAAGLDQRTDFPSGRPHNISHNDTPSGSTHLLQEPSPALSTPSSSEDEREERSSFKGGHPRRAKQAFDKCAKPAQKNPGTPEQKRPAFDLSALISKCKRLQVSPADGSASGGGGSTPYQLALRTLRSVSPRRPSEAPRVPDSASLGLAASSQRRHSTYMFPLLLNQAPTSDEDGDEDDDDGGDESEEAGHGNGELGTRLLTRGDKQRGTNDGLQVTTGRGANININSNNNNNNKEKSIIGNSAKLRSSASSPSALSTPTNELGGGGGCGGSCCSGATVAGKHKQPLAEDASGRPVQSQGVAIAAGKVRQKQPMRTRRGVDLRKLSVGASRKVSLAGEQLAEQINRRERKRSLFEGSGGPTADRAQLKLAAGNTGDHQRASEAVAGSKQQQQNPSGASKANISSKRHSLISVLSGGANQVGGNQLVSRWLSHPRSLFSTHHNQSGSAHSGGYHHTRQQRASLECAQIEGAEHYEPLIPESGFKIVVMGTSGSGKTSIIQRFAYNSFSWHHNPTVEDTYFIEFPYMKNTINISISDTSGTYQFPAMRKLAINSGDAFILVYSVDNPRSLDDLEQLRQSILDEREQAYSEASASLTSNDSSSGLGSGTSQTSVSGNQLQTPMHHHHHPQDPCRELSPSRHWSLASIFNSHQHHQHLHQLHQEQTNGPGHQSTHQSLNSSTCSSSLSSSVDNSRRSSISAAEAALKTRRTRHPPMVIVANKQDLPDEQHLVNSDEIEALVMIDWNNGFVRASAALNLNIDEIFQQVLKQARQPPTLSEAIVSRRRKSLPPKLPQSTLTSR